MVCYYIKKISSTLNLSAVRSYDSYNAVGELRNLNIIFQSSAIRLYKVTWTSDIVQDYLKKVFITQLHWLSYIDFPTPFLLNANEKGVAGYKEICLA